MRYVEHTWSSKDTEAQAAIWQLREDWRLKRQSVAAVDPGAHGGLALQTIDSGTLLHPLGDDRRGGVAQGIALCVRARVSVLVIETQFAPRAHPNMPPHVLSSMAAAAMKTARSAGLVIGALAASVDHLDIVYAQPGVWQDWVLDLPARATRDVLKEEMIATATRRAPDQMKAIPRATDREGAADAFGLLMWWMTAPMRPSPVR